MTGILVIDVGTSGVRAAVVTAEATVTHEHHRQVLPSTPAPGLVEFDPNELAAAALEVARAALAAHGPVDAVGIANQRASTILWDRTTGEPVGPGLSWQDLRTVGECLVLRSQGVRVAPNHSATKVAWLLDQVDPDRSRDLCVGTVDTWIVWHLTNGAHHVTDLSNQSVTGLMTFDGSGWHQPTLETLRIPETMLPTVVDSSGLLGEATALEGAPPIAGIVGDQQASLVGQGCVRPGMAKITFGTGAMLDLCVGLDHPGFSDRGSGGTFPLVAWRKGAETTWLIEAIMLAAGSNVEWLRDDLGLIETAAVSHEVAASVADADGVVYVPALLGLGTPQWDYGARGTLLGLTRGSTRAHVVRAVLEGVAHRGADLVTAAETDGDLTIPSLRIDGGMSANPTFTQALANASQRPVEISPVTEATTLGAAFLAGLAIGTWADWDDVAATWSPSSVVEPDATLSREQWRRAVERAGSWYPELSSLDF